MFTRSSTVRGLQRSFSGKTICIDVIRLGGPVARRTFASQAPPASTREYFYQVDDKGQLFLSDTKIRNFTTCFKDAAFLDFFISRIRRNERDESLRSKGYEFVSPCGHEINFIKPDDTVVVFQKLVDGLLTYGGTFTHPFDPTSLVVDPHSGYLYHPSPTPPARRKNSSTSSPLGPFSLLRSSLVLDNFADSLETDSESGGSYEWKGMKYNIGLLKEGQAWRSSPKG